MSEILEELLVVLKGDDAQLKRILNAVQRDSKETGDTVRRNLDFRDVGASLTGLAGGGGLLAFLRSAAQESAKTEAAWRVLRSTVGTTSEFDRARGGIAEVAQTLKLTESQVVDSFTQMVRAGYGVEEITDLLIAGGASALAFGRDAVAGLEGVASASVTGQSIALNAIGIAQNIGPVMLQARQATAGLSEEQQKAAERAAVYNLITKATAGEVATLGVTLDGLPGSQAAVNEQFELFRNNVGAIASEAIIPLNRGLSDTIAWFNGLPENVQRTATAFVAAGAGATTLAAGAGALALVLGPLAGPAGIFILAAASAAALHVALNTEKDYITDLIGEYQEYRGELDLSTQAQRQAAVDRLETTKGEMRARLELIRDTIDQDKGFVENFINSSFGKLLLPGFIEIEPGASQDLVRQANELIGSIGQVTIDQNNIRGGATSLNLPSAPAASLNPAPTGGGGSPLSVSDEGFVVLNPSVEATLGELRDLQIPPIEVTLSGEPVDIFGLVFDPSTGTTRQGAEPTVTVKAAVELELPDVTAQVAEAIELGLPSVTVDIKAGRQILGTGYEPGDSRPTDYGPGAYATVTPSVPLMTSPDYVGDKPTVELDADPFADRVVDAADIFKEGVIQAGASLVNALADGQLTGDEAAGVLGGLFGAGGSALASLIPGGAPFAPLLGAFGQLFGGLLGGALGGDASDPRSQAAKELERRGGAAEVNIIAQISQYNTFDGPITDPQTDIALDRQIRKVVRSMFDELDLGNRLDRALPARSSY